MIEEILSSMIGIVFGTIIVMVIGAYLIPIMLKRSGSKLVETFFEVVDDPEKKGKMKQWFEDVIKNGISEALKDPKVKKATLATLDAIESSVKKSEKDKK